MTVAVQLRRRLSEERGDALISGLLALGLVVLVLALAVQALAFAHARNVAQAAAQDGAEAAAASGPGAGVARAEAILAAAGGAGAGLHASAQTSPRSVTVIVSGAAPHVFPAVNLVLPGVSARASVPTERYPADETRQ
jgi:hypothetical protein